ncbi:aftiphilin isoform X2 [Mastacembelus armatus]|uniref:Aftiphilin n=1 Tax=Mastacembelus armatus TaxID=205130 RepID=A0A3Q3MYX7_9TELE|nr:aftiphilin isoform X2 [Mastacembelus armatus]
MEPHIMPLHSSSPPPLADDSEGEVGSEEDEFGDFGGFSVGMSCSPLGFADSTEPPSSLRQPYPATKPASDQPDCHINHPVEQSQPASTVTSGSSRSQIDMEGQDSDAQTSLQLTNGYEKVHTHGTHSASIMSICSPKEEAGFADFAVFTEQAAQPWCCGFSPIGSTEQWDRTKLGEQICDPGQEVIMYSEPKLHCAYKEKENVYTKVQHCEKRDAALVQPSQDHDPPQEAAAALAFPSAEHHLREEDEGTHGTSLRERKHSFNSLQSSVLQEDTESDEDREKSISAVPQTVSVYESASEDLASFCDDFSFEGASVDMEPNVSSFASQEDQTDWDQTDEEDEDLGKYRYRDSFVNNSMGNQFEADKAVHHCDQSATQETSATSNFSQAGAHAEDKFADSKDGGFAQHRERELVHKEEVRVQILGSLPPSDSFADFCSAPTQGDGEGLWAEFKDQRVQEEEKTWAQFREQVSILQAEEDTEEEQGREGQYGVLRRSSCETSLSCRVQQLLQASFPEAVVPAMDGEEELFSLSALLHNRDLPESEEEEKPELCGAQWDKRGLWWPHQDIHSAVGLQFQWGGSHSHRTLLRCLGVDTRNIVFIGMKKQPVSVPAFASGLGMLEPTKDSTHAACTPKHTAPPGPSEKPDPSTDSLKEVLPSSQRDWNSRGLSSSQDGYSALNLDYFGPEESRSSSSLHNSPPPGVDRELYELTISKLETSANCYHLEDTLDRLMSAVKTSDSLGKPQQDEELSVEACTMISGLPNLSFMKAKVLMFPSILVPRACCED